METAPTIDTGGRPGFESLLSLGIGMPLDFKGRSHHYMQARAGLGGGVDGASKGAMVLATVDVDYIYWAEPRLDLRAGMRLSHRGSPGATREGVGARLGLLPIVLRDDGNWLVWHFCLGPELRGEATWNDATGEQRGIFSVPLVAEFNFLAAGD